MGGRRLWREILGTAHAHSFIRAMEKDASMSDGCRNEGSVGGESAVECQKWRIHHAFLEHGSMRVLHVLNGRTEALVLHHYHCRRRDYSLGHVLAGRGQPACRRNQMAMGECGVHREECGCQWGKSDLHWRQKLKRGWI